MNTVELILDEPWDFSIYKINDFYAVETGFFDGIVDDLICYKLLEEDIQHLEDVEYFKRMTKQIRKDRKNYESRIIYPMSWWKKTRSVFWRFCFNLNYIITIYQYDVSLVG